ncbi:MAG: hypothetical protein SGJ07_02880 [Rhodospirillaceae bacterium]|nr:hypothetical protein [Rhodospirillaceae bacterium]
MRPLALLVQRFADARAHARKAGVEIAPQFGIVLAKLGKLALEPGDRLAAAGMAARQQEAGDDRDDRHYGHEAQKNNG